MMQDLLVPQGLLGLLVQRVRLVHKEIQVRLVPLALMVRMVQTEPPVLPERLDLLVHREIQVPLE